MKNIHVINRNELAFSSRTYRCAIGENGFTDAPKEGARKTPLGTYSLRECWYRADRIPAPATALSLRIIKPDDAWCDDPKHPDYNRHVLLPFPASHEELWRKDHCYDIIVPIGFNDENIVPGLGSAIFFHLAKPGYPPTLGCVAVTLEDMLEILSEIEKDSQIVIKT